MTPILASELARVPVPKVLNRIRSKRPPTEHERMLVAGSGVAASVTHLSAGSSSSHVCAPDGALEQQFNTKAAARASAAASLKPVASCCRVDFALAIGQLGSEVTSPNATDLQDDVEPLMLSPEVNGDIAATVKPPTKRMGAIRWREVALAEACSSRATSGTSEQCVATSKSGCASAVPDLMAAAGNLVKPRDQLLL